MKKLVALVLALVMVLSVACIASADVSPEGKTLVKLWHVWGSGANFETLQASVDKFNATIGEEKKIYVEATYNGGYADLYAKVALASQTDDYPAITVAGNTYVAPLMDDNIIVDMAPYAAATGFDKNNLLDCFLQIAGNTGDELYSLPLGRSTPMFYYNKTMADAKGVTPPSTVEDMVEFGRKMSEKDENGDVKVWGITVFNDFGYYNASFLWQLGEPLISEDGKSSPALEGTAMVKHLTDWRSWIDEGVCRPFDSTNAGANAKDLLYQGKLGGYLDSTGSLKNNIKKMQEAGFEIGVVPFPTYDENNRKVEVGGAQICMVGCGNSEEVKKAAWEFLQFQMSDEQVYAFSTGTGYMPITKSVAQNELMLKFWEENPLYKVAFDQLNEYGVCQEYPYCENLQEYIDNIQEVISLLIQEGSLTPEEAVQQLKDNTAHLW